MSEGAGASASTVLQSLAVTYDVPEMREDADGDEIGNFAEWVKLSWSAKVKMQAPVYML